MLRLLVADLLWVYELILIVRVAPDWAAQLAPAPAGLVRARARRFTHRLSEPVLVPIRRFCRRCGSAGSVSTSRSWCC